MSMRIVFNGQEYSSVEEMPVDVRREYEKIAGLLEDRDRDGIPDIVQRLGGSQQITVTQTRIVYDGKAYNSVDELPPEARQKYEQALPKLGDADHDGIPDAFQGREGLGEIRKTIVVSRHSIRSQGLGSLGDAAKSVLVTFGTALLAIIVVGILALAYIAWKLR